MIVVTAVDHNWRNLFIYPLIFIAYRVFSTLVSMAIMREWMNPFDAVRYRLINDPLQIYLAVTCWWKVLRGNVQPRKIWSSCRGRGCRRKRARA